MEKMSVRIISSFLLLQNFSILNFKQVCVYQVKHVKMCARATREGKCLKGVKMDKCDCYLGGKPEHKPDCKPDCKCDRDCDCK